jgi:hypothetical protein
LAAGVTQLVESLPSKQVVAGSSPVSRSTDIKELMSRNRTTEKIIGSLVGVSGHTFDMVYDLFFTTERVIAVLIQHPADAQQSTSLWKSVVLGDLLSGQMGKFKQRQTSQRRRRSLQSMTPDELLKAHSRNFAIAYGDIAAVELKRRFLQWQLKFHVSGASPEERVIRFNLSKKRVPEAKRLLEKAALPET